MTLLCCAALRTRRNNGLAIAVMLLFDAEDVAKFPPSSRGKEEPRLPQNLHGRSRGRVPTGGSHARDTDIEVRVLVPECYRMREYDICGVNAGTDDNQPLDPFAGGGHGGHEAVHRALSRLGGAASHKMDRTAMGIFMEYVG